MRSVFRVGVCLSASVLALVMMLGTRVETQDGVAGLFALGSGAAATTTQSGVTDALTGFDVVDNGFITEFCTNQNTLVVNSTSPKIPIDECHLDAAVEEFDGHESLPDGIGPVYNATGCGECHQTPVIGGSSQVAERRAGYWNGFQFSEHAGGSLIHDRSIDASIQETVDPRANVFTFRASQSIRGDGYVEAIADSTLADIASNQPASMRGQLIQVPIFERPGTTRVGRFGWKDQQASLVSFSADAYVNEMGITSPLQATENTSNGRDVNDFDHSDTNPDNSGVDVELFALFMRSTKAPPVDAERAATPDAQAGSTLFNQVGCAVCHTRQIVTAAPGTLINGGAMRVSNALGSKRIRPFGDFLLHDIGTGDGIVQNGGPSTRNKIRTAPLWGLRARGKFMHDFLSQSIEDAIQRHDNQADSSRRAFNGLSRFDQRRVLAFLRSL